MSEPTREFLSHPGTVVGDVGPITLDRFPLRYTHTPTVELNHDRLPSRDEVRGMQLAFRQQPFPQEEAEDMAAKHITVTVFGTALAVILGTLTSVTAPVFMLFIGPAAGGLSLLLLFHFVLVRRLNVRTILLSLLGPPVVIVILSSASLLFYWRHAAVVIYGITTFILFLKLGHRPFTFYHAYLYTHPRLKPETRQRHGECFWSPSIALLLLVLLVVALVPIVSVTLALVVVSVICVAICHRERFGRDLYAEARTILAQYLTYGARYAAAPGTWIYNVPLWRRSMTLATLTVPLVLTLSAGLYLFLPWDLLTRSFVHYDLQDRGFKAIDDYSANGEPVTPEVRQKTTKLVVSDLRRSTHEWFLYAIGQTNEDRLGFVWTLPISLAIGLLVCPIVMLAVFRPALVASRDLRRKIEGYLDEAGTWHPGLDDDGRTEWEWYVDRIRNSKHVATDPLGIAVREEDHLFLGVDPIARFPILIHKSVIGEHSYIVGDTGSGKTSLAIMPMVIQLIRGSNDDSLPPPIVIFDVKGDAALFNTVKHEAARRRQLLGITDDADPRCAFRFFTPEQGKSSYAFNPFDSFASDMRTDIQLCQLLLESLALQHGEGYGRSYYSRRARFHLLNAIKSRQHPRTFEELYEALLREAKSSKDIHETFELVATVHAMAQYNVLATGPNADPLKTIHMPTVLEERQCVYFWLPAAVESVSVREIAKLGIFALFSAAIDRKVGGSDPRQTYMFIDEFQRLVGENFKIVLEQARSFGLAAVLANQSQSDLNTHDIDLRPTIRTNTRLKRYFSVTDPNEVEDLVKISGQELAMTNSFSLTISSGSGSKRRDGGPTSQIFEKHTTTDLIKTRFITNDVLRFSDHPLDSMVQVSRGAGYSQFGGLLMAARAAYPLHREAYDDRMAEPWPVRADLITTKEAPAEIERERERRIDQKIDEMQDQLRALFAESEPETSERG